MPDVAEIEIEETLRSLIAPREGESARATRRRVLALQAQIAALFRAELPRLKEAALREFIVREADAMRKIAEHGISKGSRVADALLDAARSDHDFPELVVRDGKVVGIAGEAPADPADGGEA